MRTDELMRPLTSGELTNYRVVRTSPEPLHHLVKHDICGCKADYTVHDGDVHRGCLYSRTLQAIRASVRKGVSSHRASRHVGTDISNCVALVRHCLMRRKLVVPRKSGRLGDVAGSVMVYVRYHLFLPFSPWIPLLIMHLSANLSVRRPHGNFR
jgi:hypothetical protein